MAMNIEELQTQYDKVKAELLKLESQIKEKDYYPPIYSTLWLIALDGLVVPCPYHGTEPQRNNYDAGSLYLTKEEAEYEAKLRKLRVKLKRLANGFKPNWKEPGQVKYYIGKYENGTTIESTLTRQMPGTIYFGTKEEAVKAAKIILPELLELYKE